MTEGEGAYMRDVTEPTYTNRADMSCVMKAMCELLARQNGGAFEYSYKLSSAEADVNGAWAGEQHALKA